jgi:cytidylate kinase
LHRAYGDPLTGNRRELIVITGPPGAGKSSVSEHLANLFEPSALVAGDSFFAMIKQGFILPWLPQSRHQNTVVIEAAAATAGRLTDICSVVYDGVLGPWLLPTFVLGLVCPIFTT